MDLKEQIKTWYNADGQFDSDCIRKNMGYFEPTQGVIDRALETIEFLRGKSIGLTTYSLLSPYSKNKAGGIELYFDCADVKFCVTYYNQNYKGYYSQSYKRIPVPIYLVPDRGAFKKFEHIFKLIEKQLLALQMSDIIEK